MIYAWKQYKRTMKSDKINPILFPTNQNFLLLSVENGGISLKEYEVLLKFDFIVNSGNF